MNFEQIAERVKRTRETLDLTQIDLEKKSGVSRSTISRIELGRGDEVKLRLYQDLAKALEVEAGWLLGFSGVEGTQGSQEDEALLKLIQKLNPAQKLQAMYQIGIIGDVSEMDEWEVKIATNLVISNVLGSGALYGALLREIDKTKERLVEFPVREEVEQVDND